MVLWHTYCSTLAVFHKIPRSIVRYNFENIFAWFSWCFLHWIFIFRYLFFIGDLIWGIFEDFSKRWHFTYSYGCCFFIISTLKYSACWSFLLKDFSRWNFCTSSTPWEFLDWSFKQFYWCWSFSFIFGLVFLYIWDNIHVNELVIYGKKITCSECDKNMTINFFYIWKSLTGGFIFRIVSLQFSLVYFDLCKCYAYYVTIYLL